jgi:hypothetical protein
VDKANLQEENMQKHTENDRAQADRDAATQALQKMDEARILLNRLMGP